MDHNNVSNENTMQEKIMKQIHELGDTLERAGEKIERSGWEKIGQAIYKLGDKLEHLNGKSFGSSKDKRDSSVSSASTSSDLSSAQRPVGASVTTDFSNPTSTSSNTNNLNSSFDSSSTNTNTYSSSDNNFTGTPKRNDSDFNTSGRV
jgi:hypothetical protein